MNELRQSYLQDEEKVASKSRFGLFSSPPPIAVGDDSRYAQHLHKRGQDGKPVTNPAQIQGGTCKTGQIKSSFFSIPDSIYKGDQYKDKLKIQNQYQKKMHTKAEFHERDFIPASGYKEITKPSYEYLEEKDDRNKKAKRDENGRVKTQPPNISSNQTDTIERRMMKHPKHLPDPYDRKKQMEKQYTEQQKRKMLPVDTVFKSTSHGNKTFSKISQTYGQDAKAKSLLKPKKRVNTVASVEHEHSFKLAVAGHGDPLGKYPPFIDSKLNKNWGEKIKKSIPMKQKWKYNNFVRSRPTPSISLQMQNLNLNKYRK